MFTENEKQEANERAMAGCKYIDFDGQNCNDYSDEFECVGWDGESRRCSCGNRRVDWEYYSDSEGVVHAYATAF